ncbi:MAG: hypothetical protein ACREV2_16615 [Burkholderiales bacterium]
MVFLLAWFVIGYLFFSFILVREPRHGLLIMLPLPIFGVLAIKHLASENHRNLSVLASLAIGLFSLTWSVLVQPVHYVRGYVEPARFVMDRAPEPASFYSAGIEMVVSFLMCA